MTEQEKYMKAALRLAHKAAEEGRARLGLWWFVTAGLSDAEETVEKPKKMRCIMRKLKPSIRLAKSWAVGGCIGAISM